MKRALGIGAAVTGIALLVFTALIGVLVITDDSLIDEI